MGKYIPWVDVKCAGHVTQLLASYYEEYSQNAGHDAIMLKLYHVENICKFD